MNDNPGTQAHLDRASRPIAIVHEGFYVYANTRFLTRLAYKSLEDLQNVPLLDMVTEVHQDRLRQYLENAKSIPGTATHFAEATLSFVKADGLPLHTVVTGFKTRYGGEDCVQISLKTDEDSRFSKKIAELPWKLYLSISFLILFTVLPSTLLFKLNINNVPTVYFPEDEQAVVLDKALREKFPSDQVILLVFEGVALYSDGFFEAYHRLGQSLRRHPLVDEVNDLTTLDHIAGGDGEFVVERLIDPQRLEDSRPEQRRKKATTDRFSRSSLAALNGEAVAMIVVPKEIENSLARLALEDEIFDAIRAARLDGYLTAVAGQVPIDVAELRSMLRDNVLFIPATVFIGLFLVWWLFRRWLAVLLAGITIGVVVNSTVAIYVILNQSFTLISSIIPPLLSALTVAALVHLFNALYLASKKGYVGRARVDRALREVDRPAMFAALTTAAGLASLGLSPIVPIKVFGLISACGTGIIFLVVFRVVPNLLVRWDKRPWPTAFSGLRTIDNVVGVLYRSGIRHPLIVVGSAILLLTLGVPQIQKVHVETNVQEFFPYDHKIRSDTRYVDANLVGTMPLEVIFNSPRRDGLKDPRALRLIHGFQDWVTSLPQVDRASSIVDFIEEMHWAFHGENPSFRSIPSDAELVSQYLLVYDGSDLYDFVDRDFRSSRVVLNLNVHSANEISAVMAQIRAYLEAGPEGAVLEWEIAGAGRLFSDMEELLVTGQVYSLWGALALIFLFMLFLWRSAAAAALCMIPNLSPIFLIFSVMGIMGIWLDVATAMIASVAVGIAVDDTIHVFHGFRHRLSNGIKPVIALARAYRESGRAVVVTTIILSAQFLILVWSDFVPTRNFGLLTTVGLIAALLFDLVLLPALLIIFYGERSPVAAWATRFRSKKPEAATAAADHPEPGFDEAYWTAERKVALVREMLSGKAEPAAVALEYALPEAEVEKWLAAAEKGISGAFADSQADAGGRDSAKVRALAKAYKKLKAENRELKASRDE